MTESAVTYTEDGYPTEAGLQRILEFSGSPHEFCDYIKSIWEYPECANYKAVAAEPPSTMPGVMELRLVTCGWSGNESIIGAIDKTMFSFAFWQQSNRGGLHVYEVPLTQWDEQWELGRLAGEGDD